MNYYTNHKLCFKWNIVVVQRIKMLLRRRKILWFWNILKRQNTLYLYSTRMFTCNIHLRVYPLQFTICCWQLTVHTLLDCLQFTIYRLLNSLQFSVYSLPPTEHFTVYSLQFTLYSTVFSLKFTLYSTFYSLLFNVHPLLYSL